MFLSTTGRNFPQQVVNGTGEVSLLLLCTLLSKQLPHGGCPVLPCRERMQNILGIENYSFNLYTHRL